VLNEFGQQQKLSYLVRKDAKRLAQTLKPMISNTLIPFLESHKGHSRETWPEFDAAYAACMEVIRHQWAIMFPPKERQGNGRGKAQQVQRTLPGQIAEYEEGIRQLSELENEILMYDNTSSWQRFVKVTISD
jgi:hypothetical protein